MILKMHTWSYLFLCFFIDISSSGGEARSTTTWCYLLDLACAPRIFTKLLKVPLAEIWRQGHIVIMYFDDAFLTVQTFAECQQVIKCFLNTMVPLGFIPHPEKCVLIPSQTVEVLGFIVDSITMTVSLSIKKADKIFTIIHDILNSELISIRKSAMVIGKVIACFPATPLGPLNYRHLERQKMFEL